MKQKEAIAMIANVLPPLGAPGTAITRYLAGFSRVRNQFGPGFPYHDAARHDGTTSDWRSRLSSADNAIIDELDTMLARSRQAIANDGWAASAQGGFARLVVGGGITAKSTAKRPANSQKGTPGERLKSFNQQRDRLWAERVNTPRLVDAEETKTLAEKQRLWMNELFAGGGVFVNKVYAPDPAAARLMLQEIEYEQRDELVTSFEGRAVRGGVEVGDRHEPIAYHLYEAGHPLDDYATKPTRILAPRCHHLYRQDRVRQRIGTPWMKPVLARLRQLAMYEAYTMLQARTRAAYAGFIKQDATAGPGKLPNVVAQQLGLATTAAGGTAEDSELHVNVAAGLWTVLKPGQEPFMPTPGTPDTMYPPFVAEHLKGISAGTGLDFTTMVRWYADANYAGLRQGRLDMLAEVDWIQDLLFIQRILAADLQDWLEICIAEGRIAATGYYEDPTGAWKAAYLSTNWQGPPRASNDEIKDEAAWDMRIKGGRASLQEYCNVYGKDLEQIFGDLQECRELASEHQVRDIFDRWLFGPTVNAPKTGMRPDGTSGNPLDSQPGAAVPQGGDAGGLAGTELAELIVRQHLLQSQLEEAGHPGGNGRRM